MVTRLMEITNLQVNTKSMGKNYNATLLANHGLRTVGNNIATAFAIAEEIEFCAYLALRLLR